MTKLSTVHLERTRFPEKTATLFEHKTSKNYNAGNKQFKKIKIKLHLLQPIKYIHNMLIPALT